MPTDAVPTVHQQPQGANCKEAVWYFTGQLSQQKYDILNRRVYGLRQSTDWAMQAQPQTAVISRGSSYRQTAISPPLKQQRGMHKAQSRNHLLSTSLNPHIQPP